MPFILFRERRAYCEYWTCKPNSVEDDHSSRPAIAGGLKRPTRKFRAPSRHAYKLAPVTSPLFGLAPCGVCHAPCIAARPVRSYRTFSPLLRIAVQRYLLCGTFRQPGLNPAAQALPGTLLFGVRTFLSPRGSARKIRRKP